MIPAGSMTIAILSGHYGLPIWVGVIAVFASGIVVGVINGVLVVRTAVPSLIVTLGTLFAVAGLVLGLSVLITGTTSVAIKADPVSKALFGQFIGGTFQVIIFWWLAVGMCQAILFNSAQVSAGMSFIFNSIISVVVGGVLLTGGFGSVVGIFFGTITFAVVNQGIYFTSFDRNWSSLIIGIMLLLAVLMNNTFRKMALSYSPKKK
jgi:simple sugar transport system permease protein